MEGGSLGDVGEEQNNEFTKMVENIPLAFVCEEHYFGSFVYPLLEETRAELASSMEIMYRAPFAEILSFNESKCGENMVYDVSVDGKPESISDLRRVGRTWALSSIKGNEVDSTSITIKVKASKPIEFQDGMFAVFVVNITTQRRIWNSLHIHRNLNIIKEVLYSHYAVKENCNICSVGYDSTISQRYDQQLLLNLNESQRAAIMVVICKTQCYHGSFVEQIWGPPGTGKTMTVSVLLFILSQMNQRTLACAPTNVAIVQLASRLLSLVRESFKITTAGGDYFCPVGNVVLFDTKERLNVSSDIEEIFLEHRVKRLVECLGPVTGWKHCIRSMIDLLENCVSEYHIFVENELCKEKQQVKSFIEFVRDRFYSSARPLRRCIVTFCTHIPRSFMGEYNFKNLISLLDNLSSLESLLYQENVVSDELQEFFTSEPMQDDMSTISFVRAVSLSVLTTLQQSLDELTLPSFLNKYAITQFCFERASVIFCTTSSSHKLHAVNMEPLDILVMDEAAQLKEAESIIPLQLPGLKHAILIGDEHQLPAVVNSNVCIESGFGRSLFDRLSSLGHSKHLLNVQYRMHPSISVFPNRMFYQNQIQDAPNVLSLSHEKTCLSGPMFGSYSFINVGGEEDIIILSTVRSNSNGSVGFISSPQRTNVALTRARHCLWILGNERTLTNSESVWKDLVCDARNRHCLFDADADECLKTTIIAAKKELDQLDELVNGNGILFKHAKWKVLFSDDFRRSFGKLIGSRLKKLVLNLLLKLSSGWRPKNKSVDLCYEASSQILKQFKVEGLYVICTIDIIKEVKYIQVLKVWDILALDEIPKLKKRLESVYSAYTNDFNNRCTEKCLEGNLEVPRSWPASQKIIRFRYLSDSVDENEVCVKPDDARNYVENSKVSESLLLMKFYSLSRGVVSHLLSGKEVDLPMQVTNEQMDIISSRKSSFITGRSGTGKTTVLTMKLFQHEQKFRIASDGIYEGESSQFRGAEVVNDHQGSKTSGLCQLFVTVSPHLCYAVKQNVSHLTKLPSRNNISKFSDDAGWYMGNSFFNRFPEAREGSYGNMISSRSIALQTFIRLREVTFDRFCSVNWPHFNSNLTKKLDCSRVFTEIISHIKGGLQAGECSDGRLSYERYSLLAENRSSTLTKEKREIIHTLFQDYEKMKTARGEFDLGDFVNDIHRRLKNGKYGGDQMDFVYIDEVQDLSMRQISLFKYISQNVDEGFIFAGDTAQTIARGIDFRFQEIRSLFYKEFLSTRSSGKREKSLLSDISQLKQNFRTHAGVLDLAQSVIDIDILYEAPVLLESGNDENAIKTIFGGSESSGKVVGFGAEQVILVRDELAKTKICEYVGRQALVLTILECKGLEFHWRVIYGYMKKYDWLDEKLPQSFPTFTEARHGVLCSELKQLYVAITRTRQRLWICENKEELSKPMFDYWKMRGLVQTRKLDDSVAQAMRVVSSPQEWRERGKKNNFVMATMCFERAGDTIWEKLAKACGLRASADQMRGTNHEAFKSYVREAAGIFESIGKLESAASCYCDLREYERAGKIYLSKCGKIDAAAECFTLSGCYNDAAEAYAKGDMFSNCLSVCIKGKLFDKGMQYIEYWKEHHKDPKSMMKFVRAFCSMKSKRVFLRSLGRFYDLLSLEEESGHFLEAAELARSLGDVIKEVDLLEKAGQFREAAFLVLWYVLLNSLWGNGNKGWPLKKFPQKEELCNKVKSLAKQDSYKFYDFACNELNVLSDQHSSLTELEKYLDASRKNNSLRGEILSIRKILDAHFHLSSSKYEWEDELLVDINKHCEEKMFQNRVSIRTLVYYWNLWKENVCGIFHNEDRFKHKGHIDFNFLYFGARKHHVDGLVYQLVFKDAHWIRNNSRKGLHRDGEFLTMDVTELVPAIRSYWGSELLSVGIKVLETLEGLYQLKSNGSAFHRGISLLHIYDVSNFLDRRKYFDLTPAFDKMVDSSMRKASGGYFDLMFPLDWRKSMSEDLIFLKTTDLSVNMLDELILRNVDRGRDLDYWTIGRVMMTSLGFRTPVAVYEILMKNLESKPMWKLFVGKLRDAGFREDLVLPEFMLALNDAFRVVMVALFFISPDSFVRLLERLLFVASSLCQSFYTAKSSFAGWFTHLHSTATQTKLSPKPEFLKRLISFLVKIVQKILYDRENTFLWCTLSSNDRSFYHKLLALKLVMMLALVLLEEPDYSQVLLDLLTGSSNIADLLPTKFVSSLLRRREGCSLNLNAEVVAEAFMSVNDPLVIVCRGDLIPNTYAPCAIIVDLNKSKEEIMRVLFPRKNTQCVNSSHSVDVGIILEPPSQMNTNLHGDCLSLFAREFEMKKEELNNIMDALARTTGKDIILESDTRLDGFLKGYVSQEPEAVQVVVSECSSSTTEVEQTCDDALVEVALESQSGEGTTLDSKSKIAKGNKGKKGQRIIVQ
ncbi:uvrD-like Helicase, ATP-binding domain, P-loop containing nucleoside triphosphate hydrolase [Artemisia annua]|uniref:UvrD-like Helicase, ATP-binding domain, P-loop containing nucleoside triphosphate hydrolase n=1 Tax=Artemisia annua TaxID=35608 RepID=A0A2U1N6B1_ARTAN|nr:uvrD-like Helicase, ATP-binding domain, P-loop containing nucleoside triphosphate hydrolase [Artemisia annua]